MAELESQLRKVVRGEIKVGELLSRHTYFRIGGPADFWIEPVDFEDMANLMAFLKKEKLPWIILGNGTNVLVRDTGFRGAVINLKNLAALSVEGSSIIAGAGVPLRKILEETVNSELEGFEFTAGIPGTIGGAVVTNAGGKDGEVGDVIEEVNILNSRMDIESLAKKEPEFTPLLSVGVGFTYRSSSLPPQAIIVGVKIGLRKGKEENIRKKIAEILKYRKLTQPLDFPSAGCIFKNPHGKSAGELIASAGLAGTRAGDAEISTKHANFIINRGEARAEEVAALIEMVEKEISARFGMKLEREVKVIGN